MNESRTDSTSLQDSPAPETPQTSPRRPRIAFWIVGSLLWIAVAVGGIFTYLKAQEASGDTNSKRSAEAKSKLTPESKIPPLRVTTKQPVGAWDPDGIEDFSLTECRGETITKQDLLGKPWVACFIFTRCASTCPTILKSMDELERRLADVDLRFVTFTVDPVHDTADVLKEEAAKHDADADRWLFLTGLQADIYHLIWKSFKLPVKEITGPQRTPGFQVLHSNNIMLVDENGVVVGKYNGIVPAEMVKLRKRIREMTGEKSQAKE